MLSNTKIKQAKQRDKQYKIYDAKGLFIIVTPKGGKWWRFKYTLGEKEKTISLGTYPEVSLKQARERRDDARQGLSVGIDPSAARATATANSFEAVTHEWHTKRKHTWTPKHAEWILRRLERDIFPWLGSYPIADINAPMLLGALRRIEARGALETAHKAKNWCGAVFRYGVATGRCERDPSADLRGALPPVKSKHFASITDPKGIGQLLRAIDGYEGSFITRCALQLAPLVFVRPGELRHAEWSEINLDEAEWRIPNDKMKMKQAHIVPLSSQAVAVLRELHPLTGVGKYLFPGLRSNDRPMSENTINAALRRMGYSKEEMTGHGFRSMASTLLNEQGWNRDHIERQLAHAERDDVRGAYNYAEHLPERRKMMQSWSDYLEQLKEGAKIVNFRSG